MLATKIPELNIEIDGDSILLEQDGMGQVDRVAVHPLHIRLIASELGLLQGDADAWRRVETLERRMQVLYGRIDRLDDMIRAAAEKGHEDLEVESTYSYATWELASEFCADAPPSAARHSVATEALTTQMVDALETGTEPVQNPARTQGIDPPQRGLPLEVRA